MTKKSRNKDTWRKGGIKFYYLVLENPDLYSPDSLDEMSNLSEFSGT